MRIKAATFAAAGLAVALVVNHLWVGVRLDRIAPGAPADFGVDLPGYLRFLVKLDHFAVDYCYVLIPFAWVVAFLVASIAVSLRDFFGRLKTVKPPEDWPGEP